MNAGAEWYDLAQDRNAWAAVCKAGIASSVDQHRYGTYTANLSGLNRAGNHPCPCGRSFRRKGDPTRHSCFCGSAVVAEQKLYSCHFIQGYHLRMGSFKASRLQGTYVRLCVCVYVCTCVCVGVCVCTHYTTVAHLNECWHLEWLGSSSITLSR